ncbi:MAG: FtsX-like permease family protein, partial [Bacteroidota bacterium]
TIAADYDYAETMGIDVLQGRDFSKEFATDSQAIVINKAALDLMGLEDPLGTNLDLWGDKRKLIGVVDNVLMGSLYEPVKPMFVILSDWGGYLSLRLKRTKDLQKTMREIEGIFEKYNPAYPFEYKFADVEFQRKFTTITLTRKLATIFSFLAILITGLGIFGMSSFMAEQRTKEIGIRKVLGATTANLIMVLSSEFSKLVIAAFLLAAPTAWYLMDMYLDRYTVRTDVALWVLPLVGILIFLFTLLIVSDQARRAARANPVDSLRAE